MEDTARERSPVKPAKAPFDESKLTPPQRKALEIARAQGVKPIRSIKELKLDVEPELVDELIETIMENRRDARQRPPKKNPFE